MPLPHTRIRQAKGSRTLVSSNRFTKEASVRRRVYRDCQNITRSMGFLLDGDTTLTPAAQAYQKALDMAVMKVQSGAVSYNDAIRDAVRALAASGLSVVNYASGHVDHIDVAARRAIMTGVNQLNMKFREQSMDYLDTDLVETTAHLGARNTGSGFMNHASWQGKCYKWNGRKQAKS